jgi:hypothetical protein
VAGFVKSASEETGVRISSNASCFDFDSQLRFAGILGAKVVELIWGEREGTLLLTAIVDGIFVGTESDPTGVTLKILDGKSTGALGTMLVGLAVATDIGAEVPGIEGAAGSVGINIGADVPDVEGTTGAGTGGLATGTDIGANVTRAGGAIGAITGGLTIEGVGTVTVGLSTGIDTGGTMGIDIGIDRLRLRLRLMLLPLPSNMAFQRVSI